MSLFSKSSSLSTCLVIVWGALSRLRRIFLLRTISKPAITATNITPHTTPIIMDFVLLSDVLSLASGLFTDAGSGGDGGGVGDGTVTVTSVTGS